MQACSLHSLGWHPHDVLDHVSDAVEDVMVVVLRLPHEGGSADHFVLLVYIGFVMQLQSRPMQEQCLRANSKHNMMKQSTQSISSNPRVSACSITVETGVRSWVSLSLLHWAIRWTRRQIVIVFIVISVGHWPGWCHSSTSNINKIKGQKFWHCLVRSCYPCAWQWAAPGTCPTDPSKPANRLLRQRIWSGADYCGQHAHSVWGPIRAIHKYNWLANVRSAKDKEEEEEGYF